MNIKLTVFKETSEPPRRCYADRHSPENIRARKKVVDALLNLLVGQRIEFTGEVCRERVCAWILAATKERKATRFQTAYITTPTGEKGIGVWRTH